MKDVLRKHTFIFHGISASGKSTLMAELSSRLGASRLDLDAFVLPLILQYGNENVVGDRIREMYEGVIAHASQQPYDLIETGTDFADVVLPGLFQAVRHHGRTPVLVHYAIALDEAIRSNSARERP